MSNCQFCGKPSAGLYLQRPMCSACIAAWEAPYTYTDEQLKSYARGEQEAISDLESVRMFRAFLKRFGRPPYNDEEDVPEMVQEL